MEALEGAAPVRYGRRFKGGGRTDFVLDAQWLEKLPKEMQDAHRDFIALRDKHVGHSANDWELNIPIAYLRIDETTVNKEVSSVSVQSRRIVGLTVDSINQLKHLAEGLLVLIRAESEAEKARVLEIAKKIPVAELEARLQDPEIHTGEKRLDKSRGR